MTLAKPTWLDKAIDEADQQFDALSPSELCDRISDKHDILPMENDGREDILIGSGHGRMSLINPLEQMLDDVQRIAAPAFKLKATLPGRILLEEGPMAKHFHRLDAGDLAVDEALEYSPEVEEYLRALEDVGAKREHFLRPDQLDSSGKRYGYEYFNDLLELLRARLKAPEVRRRINRRKEDSRNNYRSMSRYMLALLEKYRKLLVLRIDFGYRDGLNRADLKSVKTIEEVRADMRRFFANGRHNELFEHVVGHIGKLEYGRTKGYHYHTVIVMDGRNVRMDAHWAQKFGFYWVDKITNGEGLFFNCNRGKRKRYGDRVGIGMVNYGDAAMRGRMFDALRYLTKEDQHVRVRPKGQKNFFRGVMPTPSLRGHRVQKKE